MERRHFLKLTGSALLATSSILVSGCSAFGGLEVSSVNADTTALGDIEVLVVVENTASSSRDRELTTQVDVQSGDTYTQSEEITVPGESENSYRHTHDLALSESLSADSFDYSASVE
ncbi:hypothetical protein [Haloarcula halophila]|uniref:hypothetical protein n=1 Tax=Haloarcula TaxID=2237 RepID=UPI0023E39B2D|nr:hypothetical protein [Halomicroarcula sp. DFY41]